jgi:hypothetical protein
MMAQIPHWKKKCFSCGRNSLIVRKNNATGSLFWSCKRFPKCKRNENFSKIDYACQGIDLYWYPIFENEGEAEAVIYRCQSKPEIVFILGTLYSLRKDVSSIGPPFGVETMMHAEKQIQGLYLQDVWDSWNNHDLPGPGCMLIVPQFPFADKLHHDFALLYQWDHSPKPDEWKIKCAVEIDFHPIHNFTTIDRYRDGLVNYPVFRLTKEDDPKTWITKLFTFEVFSLKRENQ